MQSVLGYDPGTLEKNVRSVVAEDCSVARKASESQPVYEIPEVSTLPCVGQPSTRGEASRAGLAPAPDGHDGRPLAPRLCQCSLG